MKIDMKQVEKEIIKFGVWLTGDNEESIAKRFDSYNKFEEPANQPKSCEGCEHHYHSFPNKKEHPCTQCDEDFSHYQPKEKV